ncbi:hypothetical protein PILCRDRAFT_92035 [Piloderma croceum F 1598]|uniref:Uncharacterized protein n=1 Tax=Piloderma croceum (strain F 1598) TaxID=765440 RepID=A0A0C3F6T1_PILCF|nr:hypothetical protein PILCRDRAFT_92035 [Piloderma croceum F 1598]
MPLKSMVSLLASEGTMGLKTSWWPTGWKYIEVHTEALIFGAGMYHFILFVTLDQNLMCIDRSIHNVRIECLWVDVTVQVAAFWAEIPRCKGDQLPKKELNEAELEVYGVDWEALRDKQLLQLQRDNNLREEGWSSWVGSIEPPSGGLLVHEVGLLDQALQPLMDDMADNNIIALWAHTLAYAKDFIVDNQS